MNHARRSHRQRRPDQPQECTVHAFLGHRWPLARLVSDRKRRQVERADIEPVWQMASPETFFRRGVPFDLQETPAWTNRKLSRVKYHLWEAYLKSFDHYRTRWTAWLKRFQQRRQHFMQRLKTQGYIVDERIWKLDGRMVIGLGSATVWETGFVWYRTLGLPYIPATAVKGLLRAAWILDAIDTALESLPGEMDTAERRHIAERVEQWMDGKGDLPMEVSQRKQALEQLRGQLRAYLGTTDRAGLCMCLDAIPAGVPHFKLDVMNVHYPDYYTGDATEALDTESPNPIVFLVVEQTPFVFTLGVDAVRLRMRTKTGDADPQSLIAQWFEDLQCAAQRYGIGAKTRFGYGRFVAA